METIYQILSGALSEALGWTVLHSLWQGMLIALLLAGAMIALQKRPAQWRYLAANAALFLLLLSSIATFVLLYQPGSEEAAEIVAPPAAGAISLAEQAAPPIHEQALAFFSDYFGQHLPLIVCIWLLGLAFFVLRLLGGVAYAQRLRRHRTRPLPQEWQWRLDELARRLPLQRAVLLLESALVKVPVVVGHLKPVVLLPIGAINGLTAAQVEAVLAHELAHIYRRDYLFNLLQSLVETLYYFNPAVWWISANIRLERENCCDDIAVQLCGDSMAYARALVQLEEQSRANPLMAMALVRRGKGHLLYRVRRILNQPQNKSNIMEKFTATALLLAAIFFLSVSAGQPAQEEIASNGPAIESTALIDAWLNEAPITLDSLPKGKIQIQSDKDGKKVDARIEDRQIVELNIDGQAIPKEEFSQYEGMVEEMLNAVPPPPPPPAPPAPPAFPAPPAPPAPPSPPAPPAPPP
ncbi:MAG: M56 family metallopeptidase, partial [Phaeodactylibacter sp.]|nr:M56 family metallopeptidase [Phaeodactylibacter sp.]